jgi:hypothetical protein
MSLGLNLPKIVAQCLLSGMHFVWSGMEFFIPSQSFTEQVSTLCFLALANLFHIELLNKLVSLFQCSDLLEDVTRYACHPDSAFAPTLVDALMSLSSLGYRVKRASQTFPGRHGLVHL